MTYNWVLSDIRESVAYCICWF